MHRCQLAPLAGFALLTGPCVTPITGVDAPAVQYSNPHLSAPSQSTSVAQPTSGATTVEAVVAGLAVVFGALVLAFVARLLNGRRPPATQLPRPVLDPPLTN